MSVLMTDYRVGAVTGVLAHLLEIRDVPIDVFANGRGHTGVLDAPVSGALFQFLFPVVVVHHARGGITSGVRASTVCMQGHFVPRNDGGNYNVPLSGLRHDGAPTKLDVNDCDDDGFGVLSKYKVRVTVRDAAANTIVTLARVETYLLPNIIGHELSKRGYALQPEVWVRA